MEGKTVRIVLGGALGKRFGSEWHLCVSSPGEAIRAIDANTRGELKRYLSGVGGKRLYKVAIARKDNLIEPKDEIHNPSGQQDIYILPAAKGAKSGFGKVLAGIALVALAVASGGTSLAATGFLGGFAGTTAMVGASLILGGVTQLLTPTPSFDQNAVGDSRGSNIFEGNATTTSQGGAVGLVYGRMSVSPMPISESYTAVDQSGPNSFGAGSYEIVEGGGGAGGGGAGGAGGAGGIVDYRPISPDPFEDLPTKESE